ncbi:uncharacterized protein LOC143031449 [Oratosquilla oratoria]
MSTDCLYSASHPRGWMSSREYCKSIGADLFVPLKGTLFFIFGIYPSIDPELREKRYWVGAFGSSHNTGRWISGEPMAEFRQTDLEGKCFYIPLNYYELKGTSCTEELYMICKKPTS